MAGIELLTSPCAARLENAMVARVRDLAASGERVALVAPSSGLLDRARHALLRATERADIAVVAGVDFLHHRSLATRLIERAYLLGLADAPAPRLLSRLETDAIVREAIASLPAGARLRQFHARRPRSASSIARTLGELREALVEPAALAREMDSDLAAIHAAHEALLARMLSERHATDAAGHAALATAAAGALARAGALPWTALVHHGGYDLVGAQAALVSAVAAALPTTVLAPGGAGPAHETSRAGLARWPGKAAVARPLDSPHAPPTLVDTEALFDEEASVTAGTLRLPDGAPVEAFHVRGARAEIDLAARLCAEAHVARGVPLREIAVIARSLEPVAGLLEEAFGAHGVPFTTSASAPLAREPWAQAARALLESLASGLPRPRVIEFLRSPFARISDKAPGSAAADITPDLWDEWTRAAGVVRGAGAMREDVLAWHEAAIDDEARRRGTPAETLREEPRVQRRATRIRVLGAIADQLATEAAAWEACRTHAEHATWLRGLIGRWLREPATPRADRARQAMLGAIEDIERLDAIARAPGAAAPAPDAAAVLALLGAALEDAALAMGETDGSGVRVLSAMPARAIPFREVVLIGLNQGAFPRRPRHDPFLRDAERARLREAIPAPALGVKAEARDEERQLLALALGAATDRLHVIWQRASDEGAVRAPSIFLRELARVTLGSPDLDALVARKRETPELRRRLPLTAVAGHPALMAREFRERFGRATMRDVLIEASERRQRRRSIEAIARHAGRLDAVLDDALSASARLDAFDLESDPAARARHLAHDALLGPDALPLPAAISASSLQAFGACALRWFFERGLHIEQRDEEPDDLAVGADELGVCVHAVLEAVQLHAIAQGGDPAALASPEGLAILRREWKRAVDDLAGARRAHAPLAWDGLSELWLATLERFVREDARRLADAGARVIAAESDLRHDITLEHDGRAFTLPLKGRVDRILETPDGWRVEDFKTSRKVDGHVERRFMLQGIKLQGLAYWLLARAWSAEREHPRAKRGEADIAVAFVPVHPKADAFEPAILAAAELESSWTETLAVIEATWRGGAFAFKKGTCRWCAFTAACRRDHPPTRERVRAAPEWRDYLDLAGKTTKRLTLESVRDALGGAADEGGGA